MASSPASSDLSDPPSPESPSEDNLSTAVPSTRASLDPTPQDQQHQFPTHNTPNHAHPPPSKKRKLATPSHHPTPLNRVASYPQTPHLTAQEGDNDDTISLSSDSYSSAPGSPSNNEYALREEAQTLCLWKDCEYGEAANNDELVLHVQGTHCATGSGAGPKRTKFVCEWGECQRKTSNHPSGYALKAHMRSHTKEKPYYCALPECDKAFTRSDALAKHMRTVHEPEPARLNDTTTAAAPPATTNTGSSKKSSIKLKLTNGTTTSLPTNPTPTDPQPPDKDEDGKPVTPSPASDNISYTPAYHPATGQPGFMISYPADVNFTTWESSIRADQLMRLLRRQVHWASKEGEELRVECLRLEGLRREEWECKEILLEGMLESELARGAREGFLRDLDDRVLEAMEKDVLPSKSLAWAKGTPEFRQSPHDSKSKSRIVPLSTLKDELDARSARSAAITPQGQLSAQRTPSPPPTGHSGGFDGDADPYDNYLAGRMAEYEERERLRSLHSTPVKARDTSLREERVSEREREAEAVGALMGMSAFGGGAPR